MFEFATARRHLGRVSQCPFSSTSFSTLEHMWPDFSSPAAGWKVHSHMVWFSHGIGCRACHAPGRRALERKLPAQLGRRNARARLRRLRRWHAHPFACVACTPIRRHHAVPLTSGVRAPPGDGVITLNPHRPHLAHVIMQPHDVSGSRTSSAARARAI
jgi:hypothetical protein